jgi:hypothetical protein
MGYGLTWFSLQRPTPISGGKPVSWLFERLSVVNPSSLPSCSAAGCVLERQILKPGFSLDRF